MTIFWIVVIAVVIVGLLILILSLSHKPSKSTDHTYQDALKALLDGDQTQAMRLLRDTVMKDTDNLDAYVRLGRLFREKGDAERAASIHQSLTVRPGLKREEEKVIYRELIEDYLAMGRFEKATGLLKELVRISSKDASDLRRLVALLLSRQRTEEAADTLKRYEKRFPDKKERAAWYAFLAEVRWEKGEEDKGQDAFKRATKLSKNHPYVLVVQMKRLARQGNKAKARSVIEKFIKLHPQHAEMILDIMEHIYFDLGIYEQVSAVYANLLKRYPEKREIRTRLADLKLKEGEPEQALTLLNDALAEEPSDVGFLLERTRLLLEQGNLEDVRDAFERLREVLVMMPSICSCGETILPSMWFCPGCGSQVREL